MMGLVKHVNQGIILLLEKVKYQLTFVLHVNRGIIPLTEKVKHLLTFVKPALPGFTLHLDRHKHQSMSANIARQVPILILDQDRHRPTYARIAMVENIPKKLVLHQILNVNHVQKLDIFVQKVQQLKLQLKINVPKEHMPMLQVFLNAKSAQKDITNQN